MPPIPDTALYRIWMATLLWNRTLIGGLLFEQIATAGSDGRRRLLPSLGNRWSRRHPDNLLLSFGARKQDTHRLALR